MISTFLQHHALQYSHGAKISLLTLCNFAMCCMFWFYEYTTFYILNCMKHPTDATSINNQTRVNCQVHTII